MVEIEAQPKMINNRIDLTEEMKAKAQKDYEDLQRIHNWKRAEENTAILWNCDYLGSLGEQAFEAYLNRIGLEKDKHYLYNGYYNQDGNGDCWDFKFLPSGKTVDVKAPPGGEVENRMHIRARSAKWHPNDYYVMAEVWDNRVFIVGYYPLKLLKQRKEIVISPAHAPQDEYGFRIKERSLRNPLYFKNYLWD